VRDFVFLCVGARGGEGRQQDGRGAGGKWGVGHGRGLRGIWAGEVGGGVGDCMCVGDGTQREWGGGEGGGRSMMARQQWQF
jgi:hypothetical protein